MGGRGSGRRGHIYGKKRTVQECLVLDSDRLVEAGLLRRQSGKIEWEVPFPPSRVSVPYQVTQLNANGHCYWFILFFRVTGSSTRQQEVIHIESRPQRLGGLRYYFRCPLKGCVRPVRKLYFPPGGFCFACRTCHRLTYRSVQEHDKRRDKFRNRATLEAGIYAGSLSAARYYFGRLFRTAVLGIQGELVQRRTRST